MRGKRNLPATHKLQLERFASERNELTDVVTRAEWNLGISQETRDKRNLPRRWVYEVKTDSKVQLEKILRFFL